MQNRCTVLVYCVFCILTTSIIVVSELVIGWVGVTRYVVFKEHKKLKEKIQILQKFCSVLIWTRT